MLRAFKEIAETLGGSGVEMAVRTISGVFDLLKNLAAMVGDQLGMGGGPAGRPAGQLSASSAAASDRMIERQVGARSGAPAGAARGAKASSATAGAAGTRRAKGRPAARKKGPARARPGKGRARTRRARATKKAGVKKDQLVRVLKHLTEGDKDWMSASELSAAAEAAGAAILPGNVRKVIRLRGGGLVQTRPRDGSRRGSLEYRITPEGRQRLEKADG